METLVNNNIVRTLLFGFELELSITSKSSLEATPQWDETIAELSKILLQNMIENEVYEQGSTAKPNYKKWTITEDGSIEQDRKKGQYGVELVSNISAIETIAQRSSGWRSVQEKLWSGLQHGFTVKPSNSCSTHVHVSYRRRHGWSLKRLKLLAWTVIYFERCIDSIMPEHRRQNQFCRSNRYNSTLKDKSLREIFNLILQVKNNDQGHAALADLLCPDGRWYRWNFHRMAKQNPQIQTIEFRQPPGSTTAEEATLWPQLTLSIVAGTIVDRRRPSPDVPATLANLRELVLAGAMYIGMEDRHRLTELFTGKQQLPDGMYLEDAWTAGDRAVAQAVLDKEVVRERKRQAALEEEDAVRDLLGIGLSDDESD